MNIVIQGSIENKETFLDSLNGSWFWKSKQSLEQIVNDIAGSVYVKIGRIPKGTCHIFLCDDTEPIQRKYYGKVVHKDVSAFASLSRKAIIINVNRSNKKILAHELGHIAFESFLNRKVGYHLHEMVAQYCEES